MVLWLVHICLEILSSQFVDVNAHWNLWSRFAWIPVALRNCWLLFEIRINCHIRIRCLNWRIGIAILSIIMTSWNGWGKIDSLVASTIHIWIKIRVLSCRASILTNYDSFSICLSWLSVICIFILSSINIRGSAYWIIIINRCTFSLSLFLLFYFVDACFWVVVRINIFAYP